MAVNISSDIRDHKALMLGAVMTGIGAETVLWALKVTFLSSSTLRGPMTSFAPWTINLLIISVTQISTAWLIARTHRTHSVPAVLTFMTSGLAWWAYQNFSLVRMLAVESIDQPGFRSYLSYHLSNLFVATIGLLVGALTGSPPPPQTVDERVDS